MIEDSHLLLFRNGLWDTRYGLVNTGTRYFKTTFDNIFLVVKHEVFLKSKLHLIYTLTKNYIFNVMIYKLFSYLLSFTDFRSTDLCLLLLRSVTLNISIVLFSSSLNRLNALITCHKLEPIDNART